VSVWLPLTSFYKHETGFSFILKSCKQFEWWKGWHFCGRPPRYFALLCHCSWVFSFGVREADRSLGAFLPRLNPLRFVDHFHRALEKITQERYIWVNSYWQHLTLSRAFTSNCLHKWAVPAPLASCVTQLLWSLPTVRIFKLKEPLFGNLVSSGLVRRLQIWKGCWTLLWTFPQNSTKGPQALRHWRYYDVKWAVIER